MQVTWLQGSDLWLCNRDNFYNFKEHIQQIRVYWDVRHPLQPSDKKKIWKPVSRKETFD